jgi:hypothetical protein
MAKLLVQKALKGKYIKVQKQTVWYGKGVG